MTPSHSCKKGIRYRYYVSQAVLQSRMSDAGAVFRLPAPDIEALVERFIRGRAKDPSRGLRLILEEQVQRITIRANALELQLVQTDSAAVPDGLSGRTVSLPWSKRPFPAPKGVVEPSIDLEGANKAKDHVLTAIAKARRWTEQLVAGASLAEIAKQEGKGERQLRLLMPLAFVAPCRVRDIVDDRLRVNAITAFAQQIPTAW